MEIRMGRPQPQHPQTTAQTVGPFFHVGLMQDAVEDLDPERRAGDPIVVTGAVLDGAGAPVTDAMVEIWQADGGGRYRHPADGRVGDLPTDFIGFGRVGSTGEGRYRLTTAMPGTVPGPDGKAQAPHLNAQVFARGLLDHLSTRIYFAGHPANDEDGVLAGVPAHRRDTLVARPEGEDGGIPVYRFDIVLQGQGETVFFDL
jgi:protocatechuate 3,4-dioxygenase alpha subunit